jgi:NADH-quinone oxidoreductase subunit J
LALNLIAFYVFGAIAVAATVLVIAQSNPVYSVLLLIASFMALAGLYVLLDAPFVAVTQIIVYAGAIMVLFLFVVMLLNVPHEDAVAGEIDAHESGSARAFGTLLAALLAIELVWALGAATRLGGRFGGEREATWSVREIGRVLFTKYAFAFEATSVLILIAMIGAIALAGRHLVEKKPSPISQPQSPITAGRDQWPS